MKSPSQKKGLTVTAVVHKTTGNITAFFDDLPGLVVQAKTTDDVDKKLRSLLDSFIRRLDSMKNNIDIQTTTFVI